MKIIADNKIPFLRGALEPYAEMVYLPGAAVGPDDVKDASVVITRTRTKCREALLAGSAVKFIATATIGFDHIDTAYCDAAGIGWTNAPGCNSSSVAQYITSVLLNLAVDFNVELTGRTLGVIGVGNVGSKVAAVGSALGMNVLLNDPPRAEIEGKDNFTELDELISRSDFITVHVPLEKGGKYPTYHLADADFFRHLKPSAFFINSSRGPVCDNRALKQVLADGGIRGAVLDVWEGEPDLDLELLDAVAYGTPHIAGYSADGKANGTAMSVNAISRFFGLEVNDWYPADVPEPEQTEIEIDCRGKSFEQIMLEAVSLSYDVKNDSKLLKESPETFEKQRGDYPLRREFPVFRVTLRGLTDASGLAGEALTALKFKNVEII